MSHRPLPMAMALGLLVAMGCVRVSEQANVVEDPKAAGVVLPASAVRKGPESARVTMIEIADFQCPYCGDAQPTVRHVLETYPNDVALAFVNFPLSYHAYAQSCAKAFQAAARQGLAWALYDQMFAHQSALTDADLTGYASAIGLDVVQFNADRASQEIEDQVTEQTNLALSLGVNSTPTFLVGGYRIVGAMPLSTFVKTIDKVLAGTVPGVGP